MLLVLLSKRAKLAGPRAYDIGINTVEFSCLRLEATHRRYSHVENRRHAFSGAGFVIRGLGLFHYLDNTARARSAPSGHRS